MKEGDINNRPLFRNWIYFCFGGGFGNSTPAGTSPGFSQ